MLYRNQAHILDHEYQNVFCFNVFVFVPCKVVIFVKCSWYLSWDVY